MANYCQQIVRFSKVSGRDYDRDPLEAMLNAFLKHKEEAEKGNSLAINQILIGEPSDNSTIAPIFFVNIMDTGEEDVLQVTFDTKWHPLIEGVKELGVYLGLDIEMIYYELGNLKAGAMTFDAAENELFEDRLSSETLQAFMPEDDDIDYKGIEEELFQLAANL